MFFVDLFVFTPFTTFTLKTEIFVAKASENRAKHPSTAQGVMRQPNVASAGKPWDILVTLPKLSTVAKARVLLR